MRWPTGAVARDCFPSHFFISSEFGVGNPLNNSTVDLPSVRRLENATQRLANLKKEVEELYP